MEIANKYEMLTKTVRVSDPSNWYGQKTVKVSLRVTPEFKGQREVRLLVNSIDDFMMYHAKPCFNEDQVKSLYNQARQHMYDTMPSTISVRWLLQHGYDIF